MASLEWELDEGSVCLRGPPDHSQRCTLWPLTLSSPNTFAWSFEPFLFDWVFNTTDALMLSRCSILKRDLAYSVVNVFWVIIGIVGILRAGSFIH
jgi:hypothetical protein